MDHHYEQMLDLIDDNNNVIGQKKRKDLTPGVDRVRFVHVYVFNEQGELAVQQRSRHRSRPNMIDAAASGHVDSGEAFDVSALREMQEEIGIEADIEYMFDSWGDYGLCKVYKAYHNGPFEPDDYEVALVDFKPIDDIKMLITNFPYLVNPGFRNSFKNYLAHIGED